MKHFICLLTIFFIHSVSAEVQQVVLKWNALLCLNACAPKLHEELAKIPNVAAIQMNDRAGIATMQWKPDYPFTYAPFNLATRFVGIRIEDFRLRVRGTILEQGDNFFLISSGDYTAFLLIGPGYDKENRYVTKNIATRQLPAQTARSLRQLSQSKQMVSIEGPLYEPLRNILMLIVEQLNVENEDQK